MRRAAVLLAAIACVLAAPAGAQDAPKTSCIGCHGSTEWFPETAEDLVSRYEEDIHTHAGISCHDCHGGNPDPALFDDLPSAMDPDYAPNPYRDPPAPADIPAFCGRCHSNAEYMRKFRPSARVDQEVEYRLSQHGKALEAGVKGVATCVDCHRTHGILSASNPSSSVYPTHVADTCGHCHSDPELMEGRIGENGHPLPIDQEARWRRSVHANAMLARGDLSAPTCNDCHGNHGAAPPGIESVAFVCGQCHGREADLFRASVKHDGIAAHNEMFLDGETDCTVCHSEPEPQAALAGLTRLSECAACHGNHSVVRPTVAMLAPLPATPCAFCHESAGAPGGGAAVPSWSGKQYEETRDALLAGPAVHGLDRDELFDALLDAAEALPQHTEPGGAGESGTPVLRPEFKRLLEKFRLGRIHYGFDDAATGERVTDKVVRCTDCHAAGEPGETGPASAVAREIVLGMAELTFLTAEADRRLLAAHRGGVEVREALLALDNAVAAQIDLEVLVHTFSTDPDDRFMTRQREGIEHAKEALDAADRAHEELAFRRKGLGVSLVVIAIVLIALALKIRQISAASG